MAPHAHLKKKKMFVGDTESYVSLANESYVSLANESYVSLANDPLWPPASVRTMISILTVLSYSETSGHYTLSVVSYHQSYYVCITSIMGLAGRSSAYGLLCQGFYF